jgi:uncharacterized repeat protein (TIGR01451 family)
MKTRLLIPIIALMASLGVGVAQAQLKPSSEVLLPYFEVDLKDAGKTTLLAVGNILDQPVEGQIEVRTNWGIPISTFTVQWEPRELKSFNLRDWLLQGKMPNRTLRVAEKDQMKASLTGKRSPKDSLLYATPVAPDLAVGSVVIRTTGSRPAAFWGDYLLVDPARSSSLGDSLVNLDLSSSCNGGLCQEHALRFLAGTAVNADTEMVLWTKTVGQPRQTAYPEELKFKGYATIYDESGKHVEDREIRFTPLQVITLGSLGLSEPFGWIELRTDVPVFIGVHYNQAKSDGAALQAYCIPQLPRLPDPDPGLDIKKWTNGQDADTAPGPKVTVGSVVTWDYIVRNTGATILTDVKVSDDDPSVQVSCPKTTLETGESMTCKGQGIAQACQYKNIGTAVGTSPDGFELKDQDPSHYYGDQNAKIDVETAVNGQDADEPLGPNLSVGAPVSWTYKVTNTGDVKLTGIVVADDKGVAVTCPKTSLFAGESMTCSANGAAAEGFYRNVGTVTAKAPCGPDVQDSDPSNYFGKKDEPGIKIEKLTNGHSCNLPPGPMIAVGDPVLWEYVVTNTGNVVLNDIKVTDDKGVAVTCPKTTLQPAETMTCTGRGVAVACQYTNIGMVTAKPPAGPAVNAQDDSFYWGQHHAAIDIEKATNGQDADTAPGPTIQVGDPVTWTYMVTNTGDVTLTGVTVTDDQGVNVTCPKKTLQPGESMTCTGKGTAVKGQYRNVGAVTGAPPCGPAVTDQDASHYFGDMEEPETPGISLKKYTNGQDADTAPGPHIQEGDAVLWTYIVTNTGNTSLGNVKVTDDRGVAVSCPKTSLQSGESMTCSGKGTATVGQYKNIGTAVGTPPKGSNVTSSDPSHYYGDKIPDPPKAGITIKKYTNGQDADTAPGPKITVGASVLWTYIVTNAGEVSLSNVKVTDDRGVLVSCPKSALQAGESMTCTGNGVATAGQYKNIGSVVGTPPTGPNVTSADPSHYFGEQPPTGTQGCTPGYWKNHTDSWAAAGYNPSTKVQSVFSQASGYPALGPASLLSALSFDGGSSIDGAAGNLLRAAVAGLLDASHPGVDYPRAPASLIADVNAALATRNRDTILGLASEIDADNNLGCPLN